MKFLKNKANEPESNNMEEQEKEVPKQAELTRNQKEFGAMLKGRKFLGIIEAVTIHRNTDKEETIKQLIRVTVDGKEATKNEIEEYNRHLIRECLV